MFSGNAVVSGGTFNLHSNTGHGAKGGFERLQEAVLPGAFHNSAERSGSPRCRPNTRISVLATLTDWINDSRGDDGTILWLHGHALVGKSSVAQTFAERCHASKLLLASFFFSEPQPDQLTTRSLVPTIAYQVVLNLPQAREPISAAIEHDPLIFTRSLAAQFESLLVKPIELLVQSGIFHDPDTPRLIIIDDLNKCGNTLIQCNILDSISSSFQQHRFPLQFLISTRPSREISATFAHPRMAPYLIRLALESSYLSVEDGPSAEQNILGVNLCLMCLRRPAMANSYFCSQTCVDNAASKCPMILEVPKGHDTFKNVVEYFTASWGHPVLLPSVKHVYKIFVPRTSMSAYNAYREVVEARGQFIAAGRSEGNENHCWHGTTRGCNLGDNGNTQFCIASNCSLCRIIRKSYDNSRPSFGRFGNGIYSSLTSYRSDEYCTNRGESSTKAVLLNKVVVGKAYKVRDDNPSFERPPAGFDSVLWERGTGPNPEEVVVYNSDAIRPSFLVIYEP